MSTWEIRQGDCLEVLRGMEAGSVQTCVTSPPYFGLRDYGHDGQIGLEATPQEYVRRLVEVFAEVRRVLRDDGTLWLNLGSSYYHSNPSGPQGATGQRATRTFTAAGAGGRRASAYDIAGTTTPDCQCRGCSSGNPCGGRTGGDPLRTPRSGPHPFATQAHESLSRIRACMEELLAHLPTEGCSDPLPTPQSLDAIRDRARTALREAEPALASLASMLPESSPRHPEGSPLSGTPSAFLSSLRSFCACARRCVRMWDAPSGLLPHTADSAELVAELADCTRCTFALCSQVAAWLNPPQIQPYCTRLKPKDLIGIPWRVAFALQEDGWYLRSDIIWAKPNPTPESVTDRPTKAHEYLFLLAKSERYYYDHDAIKEPLSCPDARGMKFGGRKHPGAGAAAATYSGNVYDASKVGGRNKRTVWTVATAPFKDAHFAVFPPDLIRPCILAGCPVGGTVMDPFCGSGTTGFVAFEEGRSFVGIEINPLYCEMSRRRIGNAQIRMLL